VEILTVVVILGIASAIVVPQISSHSDLQAASAARVLMADLIYAQNRAIATQSMVYVTFNATTQTYTLSTAVPLTAANTLSHPVTHAPYAITLGPAATTGLTNVSFQNVTFDGKTTLAFDELGTPYACDPAALPAAQLVPLSAGSLTLTSGQQSLTINIEPYTGEITVQ
jgi:Tfp pilus assembly protein FimT